MSTQFSNKTVVCPLVEELRRNKNETTERQKASMTILMDLKSPDAIDLLEIMESNDSSIRDEYDSFIVATTKWNIYPYIYIYINCERKGRDE